MDEWARNLDSYGDGYDETDDAPAGHTPGPWDWTDDEHPDSVAIATVGTFNIIVDDEPAAYENHEESDARLIASAPTLLDACQEAYKAIDDIHVSMALPALHPVYLRLRGVQANLKHVIEDATGDAPQ